MTVIENKDILKVIGKKIQEARKEKGYTQEYVAEKIDKSVDTFRGIGVRIDIWTHFMRECIINYVH